MSAEAGEVEVDEDLVAFGRKDLDGGGLGSESIGREIEFKRRARQIARITVAPAIVVGPAVRVGWREPLVVVGDLDLKVSPEIPRARDEGEWSTGARIGFRGQEGAVSRGQLDLNDNSHNLHPTAVIEAGLLSAVVADAALGELRELREWSEKSNRRDVGPGPGSRERLDVFAQERCIVALAEEIGFADGLVGQRRVKGE